MPLRLLWVWCAVALSMSGVRLPVACGDTFNWIGLGNTANWDDKTGGLYENWGTIALPTSASDVNFGFFLSSGDPNLHGSRTVNSVSMASSGSFTLTGGAGDVLTLASGYFTQVDGAAASGAHQVNVPVAIQQDGIWNIAGGGVTFTGGVTSSFGGSAHTITKVGAGPLTLSGGASGLSQLLVKEGDFVLDGGGLDLAGGSELVVGDGSAVASLLVENGAALTMHGNVGTFLQGTASTAAMMTITGVNTLWTDPAQVSVGLGGPAVLKIEDKATAALGTVNVGGSNSGTINVQGGATLSDASIEIGVLSNSPNAGVVTVSGAGSQWNTTGQLSVGGSAILGVGNGSVTISNGGVATAGTLMVFDSGSVTIDGGQISTGILGSFAGGGTINLVADSIAGPAFTVNGVSGPSGYAGVISGAGTLYKSGDSWLTLSNANTLTGKTVIAGGQIVLANSEALQNSKVDFETTNGLNVTGVATAYLGSMIGGGDEDFGSTSVVLNGSSSNAVYAGNMTGFGTLTKLGSTRQILSGTKNFMTITNVNAGALEVDGKLQGLGVVVNSGGTLAGTGQVGTNVLVNSGGAVAPGTGTGSSDASGVLRVESAYFENGSELDITLHGTGRGTKYSALVATDDLALGGKLRVSLFGFMPAAGQTFDILDWGSVSGTFSGFVLPTLSPILMWDKSKLYTDGVLSVAVAGDYNGNGVVDAADYVLWRDTLGATGTALAADGNNNGTIDPGDYDIWRSNFGRHAGSPAAASIASVPEPSVAILMLVGLLLLVCSRQYFGVRGTALC